MELVSLRYEKLKKDIEKYNHHYYNLDESLVTDFEYDMLLKELEEIENNYPELRKGKSLTENVGGSASEKFSKFRHKVPMLSLSNTYSINDLISFDERIKKIVNTNLEYILELKLDGLSISLIYEKGIFSKAITRGDGIIGEDVTENVSQINSIPKRLNKEIDIEVRGEIVLPLKEFERINLEREENGETVFANPRNAAAGTLRQLDKNIVKDRNLDCYVYYLVEADKYGINSHLDSIKYIQSLGFKTTNIFNVCNSISDLEEQITYWNEERKKIDYETDGLVIKVNDFSYYDQLGYTAKSPRWAIAYKFKAEQKETSLLDITYQIGRTGVITPVAELKPVNISGSVVKRASLHNFDEIKRLGLKIGDTVIIEKAAEIIPQIVRVETKFRDGKEKDIEIPEFCPSCNSKLVKEKELVAIKCKNPNCIEKVKRRIEYFVSRDALNIQGMGDKIVDKFVNLGILKDFTDIYNLKEYKEELISLEKMGEKSVEKLLNNIENSLNVSFDKVFYALGIEFIGKTTSRLIVEDLGNIGNILNADVERLRLIEGVGDKVALSVYKFFKIKENLEMIEKMKKIGFNLSIEKKEVFNNSFITNRSFLATGKLEKYSREEIKELILKYGGKYISTVSKNLDYLIIGEKAGSKLSKAKSLGINILSEEEFLKKLEEGSE